MQVGLRDILNPLHYRPMWLRFSKLHDHIRIQQVHVAYRNAIGARLEARFRTGVSVSVRAWFESSNSLREARAEAWSRRHSSAGTNTAASAPRFVTSWGP